MPKLLHVLSLITVVLAVAACGSKEPEAPASTATPSASAAPVTGGAEAGKAPNLSSDQQRQLDEANKNMVPPGGN